MATIIGVGIAAVDIINITDGYPAEDEEVRALNQSIRRGGNVTNTLVVLSQLGHECVWLGTLADDINSQIITADLKKYNVDYSGCERIKNSKTPASYITLNQNNGSRTIVHYRDLPELSTQGIHALDINKAQWIHFEARNVNVTRQMMDAIKHQAPGLNLSVEVEKPRDQLEHLFSGADVYFFSRAFATTQGFKSAQDLLHYYRNKIADVLLVCTWGEQGAYALQDNQLSHAPAQNVSPIIDTVGAGDTFNAGFIHARLNNNDVQTALENACALAAKKISLEGFDGIQNS
ncbi:PfkB family carbohydrate kinase [Kaarinaea lacus]